nr:hypothetical protein GCM10025699_23740 [Microbacterium flavescens]
MNADDDGVTLVELIIYIVVTSLFLGLLALMFVNGLRAQAQTTDRDSATGQSNVVSNSIQSSLRNATAFTITSANRALIAKVSTPGGGRECRAWVVTTGGDVRYRVAASAISTSDTSAWTVLVDGDAASGDGAHPSLSRRDGTHADGSPRFVPVDADGDGLTDAFSRSGLTLSYGLDVTRGDATVSLSNGVTAQAFVEGTDTLTCW